MSRLRPRAKIQPAIPENLRPDQEITLYGSKGTAIGEGRYVGPSLLPGYIVVSWEDEEGNLQVCNWIHANVSKRKT